LRVLVLESVLQRARHVVRARAALRVDHPGHVDERRVLGAAERIGAMPVEQHREQERQVREPEQLEKDAPAARAPLLLDAFERELLEDAPLPVFAYFSHRSILFQ